MSSLSITQGSQGTWDVTSRCIFDGGASHGYQTCAVGALDDCGKLAAILLTKGTLMDAALQGLLLATLMVTRLVATPAGPDDFYQTCLANAECQMKT